MSQVIRSEDLEAGVMFEVSALGTVPLGQTSSMTDVVALQKPIRDLYLNYQKPTGAQPLPSCRLVVSNRGLAVTEAPTQDRTPSAETLYNIPSVVFAAAVRFLIVGKKERDFRCAFEAIDSDGPPVSLPKGKNDLYVPFDKKWKYLAKVTSHPAICACVIQRMTGVRALELHAFVCESDVQARDVIFCLTSALKNFTTREAQSSAAIYGHGPYDLPPQMGGMRNEAEHLMVQQQQQTRPPGSGEGVYGFQGQHPDQMMAYRGADAMVKPGGMRPDLGGPVGGGGGMWDPRTQDGRAPLGSGSDGQQGSDKLSNQRDQLMRNFANDQRKNEPLRIQAEQGIYDQQPRGVYDIQPPRIIYDPLSSRGVYDSQPSKGIYDAPSAIYEYRPPQSHPEPTGGIYAAGPPQPSADPYTLRRDIYDPQLANRSQLDPGTGNLYGQMRAMSGSSERLFDEPRRGGQDPQKSNYDAPPRQPGGGESYGGPAESEYAAKGFALPRAKVNYDGDAPPGAGEYGSRPSSFGGYDSGNLQKPPPLGSTSSPYSSADRRSPLPQVKAKVQPPAPLAKNLRPSATSPTTESNPGLRPTGGGGSMPPRQEWTDAPIQQQSVPVAPKKVMGIKVFPTIMLRGNQAAAAAAAAEEDGEDRDPAYASHPVDNLRSTKPNGTGPERQPANRNAAIDDYHGQDRRKKGDEMESAFGGLTVDPGRAGRNAANDFEQSLGYLP